MVPGATKIGPKKVSRKAGPDGGPRCVRKKPSSQSWAMNRYIDRQHKDLCGKSPIPTLVEEQGGNEAAKCEALTHSGRAAKEKCAACDANPNCEEGVFTKSRMARWLNKCECKAKAALADPRWTRSGRL